MIYIYLISIYCNLWNQISEALFLSKKWRSKITNQIVDMYRIYDVFLQFCKEWKKKIKSSIKIIKISYFDSLILWNINNIIALFFALDKFNKAQLDCRLLFSAGLYLYLCFVYKCNVMIESASSLFKEG